MVISFILGTIFCLLSGGWLLAEVSIPLWSQFLIDIAVWGLWLGSGCLAATAAELLNRRPLPHALLGLCLPYIYPFCLIRYSRGKTAKEEQKRQQQEIQHHAEEKEKISNRFRAMQEKRDQERLERIAGQQNISVAEAAAQQEAFQALRERNISASFHPAGG